MSIATRENVAELYVAFFGRAPDSVGLDYWVNDSGLSLEQISASFFDQSETKERYPIALSNESFVAAIYQNLFNREPDQTGLDYWVGELTRYEESGGTEGISRDKMILAIVNGAQDVPEEGIYDLTILNNKTDVGLYFADEGLQYIDFYVNSVTEVPESVQDLTDRVDQLLAAGAPQVVLSLDEAITVDDIIDEDEVGEEIPVSGYVYSEFAGVKEVSLVVNGNVFTAIVDENDFSIVVPGRDLALDEDHTIEGVVVVTGSEGTTYSARDEESYNVAGEDIIPPHAPVITSPISGDGMVNAEEADHFSIGGTSESLSTIDLVIRDSTGHEITVQTISDTREAWGISGLDLTGLKDGLIRIEVMATDLSGNRSEVQKEALLLDQITPLSPSVALANDSGVSDLDRYTNDPTLAVEAYDPFDTIEYSLDGKHWSEDTPEYLYDDRYTVHVREVDRVGNISSSRITSFTLDRTAAEVAVLESISKDNGLSSEDRITNDTTLSFFGSSEDDATVELWLNEVNLGTVTASSLGAWSKNYSNVDLEDGVYVLYTRTTDIAGNVSEKSEGDVIVIDTTVGLEGLGLKSEDDSGLFPDDQYTNVSNPAFSVVLNEKSSVGDSVELLLNGYSLMHPLNYVLTEEDLERGEISLQIVEGDLGNDGEKSFSALITDVAGNSFVTENVLLVLDRERPQQPSIALLHDTGVSDADHLSSDGRFVVTPSEADSLISYSLDGVAWQLDAPETTIDGMYQFYVRETDRAGNHSLPVSFSFTVDTMTSSLPQINMPVMEDNIVNAQEAEGVTVSGIAEAYSMVEIVLTDAEGVRVENTVFADGAGKWSSMAMDVNILQAGNVDLEVSATDMAGNMSPVAWSSLVLNNAKPVAPVLTLNEDTGFSDSDGVTQTAHFTVVPSSESDSLEFSVNGVEWSETRPVIETDGYYTIQVREINGVGSISDVSTLSFLLDTTVPEAPVLSLSNDTGVDGDLCTSDPTLDIVTHESESRVWYLGEGGSWSETPPAFETDGLQSIWIREEDRAGNLSDATEIRFMLDRTAPLDEVIIGRIESDTGVSDSDFITQDRMPVLYGNKSGEPAPVDACLAGAEVWVYRDGSYVGKTTILDDFGSWRYAHEGEPLDDGVYAYAVRLADKAGNLSELSSPTMITVDNAATLAPVIALANDSGIADDLISNDGTIAVTLNEETSYAEYSLDGTTWSKDPVSYPADGTYTVQVREVDLAGNESEIANLTFTLDTTIPFMPLLTLSNDTGSASDDNVTSDATLTAIEPSESGGMIYYSVDNGLNWQTEVPLFEIDGEYSVWAKERDLAGNESETSNLSFTLDTASTLAPVIALANDSGIADDLISNDGTIVVTLNEETSYAEYSLDGTTWSKDPVSYPTDGMYTVQIREIDLAGNASEAASLTFTLDTAATLAPVIALANDSGIADDLISNDGTIAVTLNEETSYAEYSLDGTTWSKDPVSYPADGTYTVQVREVDLAGNESEIANLTFTLDTTIPFMPLLTLSNDTGSASDDNVTSDATLTAIEPSESGGMIYYSVDNGLNWQTEVPLFEIDGEYSVWAKEIDLAGNESEAASLTFTLDTAPTLAPAIALANDSGIADDLISNDGTIAVALNEETSYAEYSLDGTLWSKDPVNYPADGTYTVQVREVDLAGNASEAASLNFTLDSTAPALVTAPSIGETATPVPAVDLVFDEANEVGLYADPTDTTSLIGSKIILDSADVLGNYSGAIEVAAQGTTSITAVIVAEDSAGNRMISSESVVLGTDVADLLGDEASGSDQLLYGFDDDDTLYSGLGSDSFLGGAGSDRFVFVESSGNSTDRVDLIVDFVGGSDTLVTGYAGNTNPGDYEEADGSTFADLAALVSDAESNYLGDGTHYMFYYNASITENSTDKVSGYLLIDWGDAPDGQVDQVIELAGIALDTDFNAEDIVV